MSFLPQHYSWTCTPRMGHSVFISSLSKCSLQNQTINFFSKGLNVNYDSFKTKPWPQNIWHLVVSPFERYFSVNRTDKTQEKHSNFCLQWALFLMNQKYSSFAFSSETFWCWYCQATIPTLWLLFVWIVKAEKEKSNCLALISFLPVYFTAGW